MSNEDAIEIASPLPDGSKMGDEMLFDVFLDQHERISPKGAGRGRSTSKKEILASSPPPLRLQHPLRRRRSKKQLVGRNDSCHIDLIMDSDEEVEGPNDTHHESRAFWFDQSSRANKEGGYVEDAVASDLELDELDEVEPAKPGGSDCHLPFARKPSIVSSAPHSRAGFVGTDPVWNRSPGALPQPPSARAKIYKLSKWCSPLRPKSISLGAGKHGRSCSEGNFFGRANEAGPYEQRPCHQLASGGGRCTQEIGYPSLPASLE